jgi:hypothetical protein
MLPNYRTTTNFREIAKIIAHPKNYKNSILWQSNVSNRYIFDIEDIQVNERFMSFSTKLGGKMLPFFNQLNQTYCKVPYRETVFKVSIINIVDNTVTFNLPSDVKTLEAAIKKGKQIEFIGSKRRAEIERWLSNKNNQR